MKKFVVCLSVLVLILGFGGMAKAAPITFNFNPDALLDNSNAAAIGTYMTDLYGPAVTVSGHNGPASETGLFTLLGGRRDGYIESELFNPWGGGGANSIQINFATPIASVQFDWGTVTDAFNAYADGSGTAFFHKDWNPIRTGNSGLITFAAPVSTLTFVDGGIGEVGIDNLVVTKAAVPEPMSLLLLGFGLVGLAGMRRRVKK